MGKLIKTAKDWNAEIAAREAATEAHWKAKLDAKEKQYAEDIESSEAMLRSAFDREDAAYRKVERAGLRLEAQRTVADADGKVIDTVISEMKRGDALVDDAAQIVESGGLLIEALRALGLGEPATAILDALDANADALADVLAEYAEVPSEMFEQIENSLTAVATANALLDDIDAEEDEEYASASNAASDFTDEPTVEMEAPYAAESADGLGRAITDSLEAAFFARGGTEGL